MKPLKNVNAMQDMFEPKSLSKHRPTACKAAVFVQVAHVPF